MAAGSMIGEALFLGLASGPACVASCGPVVVPSLLAERAGWSSHARYLGAFLSTRLCGYLVFAAVAWQVGALIAIPVTAKTYLFASIHFILAAILIRYAFVVGRPCAASVATPELVTIGGSTSHRIPGAVVLGFFTGVSLCPPFVAAGVRAAESATMFGAVLFFGVFFIGTAVWFLPFAALGWVRRNEAVVTVARMAMVIIAVYYLFVGLTALLRKNVYGL